MTVLVLLPLLLENAPCGVVPISLTSQATEAEAAAAAAASPSFSFIDPPKASPNFARGGSVSEKERAACANDLAAAEAVDDDEGDEGKARVRGEESEARGEESGRRTPQPAKRS